jgi:hypothetical protein
MSGKKGKNRPPVEVGETVGRQKVLEAVEEKRGQGANTIRFLPVAYWPENGLFAGARDAKLHTYTKGRFQEKLKDRQATHPIFVLKRLGSLAHRVCPCSSKKYQNQRAIPKGCVLEHTYYVVRQRTYLVEDCVFQIPKDKQFIWNLRYWGRVPETNLESEDD